MTATRRPLIIAHRGASQGDDQNTLTAFRRAVDMGADMIEFDIRRTRDNEFVIHHDAAIAGHVIAQMTISEIHDLDHNGHEIPTLAQVLDTIPSSIGLDIELKESGYERDVVQQVLLSRRPQEFVITSFDDQAVCAVRASFPDVRTGLLLGARRVSFGKRLQELFPAHRSRACWASCVAPNVRLLHLGYLWRMARAGIPVCVWTVNDEATLTRLIADPRVFAIVTDEVELALRLRDSVLDASGTRTSL